MKFIFLAWSCHWIVSIINYQTKEYRKELYRQFKYAKSKFKIALAVDMWLTGFYVPFLDTIYIDKPIQCHNLIQTISRINRKFKGKNKGLVVDFIGIKKQMNLALAEFGKKNWTKYWRSRTMNSYCKRPFILVG